MMVLGNDYPASASIFSGAIGRGDPTDVGVHRSRRQRSADDAGAARRCTARNGPAQGLPDTKVGTFTQALNDEAKKDGWTVISMKNDWKRIFAFD